MNRRYSNVRILTEVYVTSHADYWFKVMMDGGPSRSYCPHVGFEGRGHWITWEGPKYLIDEVDRQIAQGCRDGRFKFYERDRDGNKRYDNLRYHDDEHVQWFIDDISARQP